MQERPQKRTSIHISYLLRHAPEAAGLDMDRHGWVSVSQLIDNVNAGGKFSLTLEQLREIVALDQKGRFRFSPDGARIKACQGHSIAWVEPELEIRTPPEFLFHGTTAEALQDILKTGAVLRMNRHAVHMQADVDKAWQSAMRRRNKTPVVLKIAAGTMHGDGVVFRISENGVWFCERVPTGYIAEVLRSSGA